MSSGYGRGPDRRAWCAGGGGLVAGVNLERADNGVAWSHCTWCGTMQKVSDTTHRMQPHTFVMAAQRRRRPLAVRRRRTTDKRRP